MNNPIVYLRLEGIAVFIAATVLYFNSGFGWLWYVLLLFAFDLFMLGYLANPRIGAFVYNFGHSFIGPSFVAVIFLLTDERWLLGLACLWFAHIGIDRALGYGLKLASGFKHTHLGDIGK
jgi:hypothetical protein